MKRTALLIARIREFLASRRVDRDLTEELESHVDLLTDDYLRRGLSAEEARAAARRDLGGLDQVKESIRDRRGLPWLDTWLTEARYALRQLAKAPGFTAVAVLTLALGIGVNAAIFSVVDTVVLRPLPYPDADRLVSIWETLPERDPGGRPAGRAAAASRMRIVVAPANLVDYRRRAASFAGVTAYASTARNLTGSGSPERLIGEEVTFEYFEVLRARPALGRGFLPSDDVSGASSVVILSHGLWQQRFGGDPGLVGRTVMLDGRPCEVVGIMPDGFRSLTSFGSTDPVNFWAPAAYSPELLESHGDHEVDVVARLKPGVGVDVARAELATVSEALAAERPDAYSAVRTDLALLGDDVVRDVRKSLFVLLGAVGVILLMACVNVANLLIIRAVGRRREIAVRFALGASRGRVMLQLFTQSLVLASLGCAMGLVLAGWTKSLLVRVAPATIPRLDMVSVDARVLAITVSVSLLTGALFGMLPAWQVRRARPIEAMTGERVGAGAGVLRWRNVLMLAEVALSTVLLVGAGLTSKSLLTLNRVELGFRPDHVLAMNIALPMERYKTGDARLAFFEELERRVGALPAVRGVAFANRLPMRGGWESGLMIESATEPSPAEPNQIAGFQAVNPGYFATLGIPIARGRLLAAGDRNGALPVAVVTEQFVRRFLAGGDPIGRRLRRGPSAPWITIVGVVADVRRDGQAASIDPQVYLPAAQTSLYPTRLSDLAVRSDVDPVGLASSIRACVWSVDRQQPVTSVRTLEEVLVTRSAERRFQTLLFVLFAALALALAVVGIYGVVVYAVSQRQSEIGIRMALGADRSTILGWVVAQAGRMVFGGAAVGLAAAWALSRLLRGLLFEVAPTDPAAYVAATLVLTAVGLGASYIAARRATQVDPLVALRCD